MKQMLLTFFVALLCIYSKAEVVASEGELVFVNVIYRHGNRTPVKPYSNDPYKNISFWPTGWGQLTKDGMMGHYDFGKWLRRRYDSLLPKEYDRADIFVQSTDVDRTLMSAYSNLAGLYEPDPTKNWSPTIKWRPIPVHTTPEAADMVNSSRSVLAAKKHCPKYMYLLKELWKTPQFTKLLVDNLDLFEKVANATGDSITTLEDLEFVYNTLYIETLFNFTLPKWTKDIYPQPMKNLSDFSFATDCYTPELARLKIGPLLKEMVTNMKKKATGKLDPDRKMYMYSAHDVTVANLLQGLRVFDYLGPPYFSAILIELYRGDIWHYVKVFYRNSSLTEPILLTIPQCTSSCPLDKFVNLLKPVLPDDWEAECRLTLLEQAENYTAVGIASYTTGALLVILLLATIFKICRTQGHSDSLGYQSLSVEAT